MTRMSTLSRTRGSAAPMYIGRWKKGPNKPAPSPESRRDDLVATRRRKTVRGPGLLRHVARFRLDLVVDALVGRSSLLGDLDEPVAHGGMAAVAVVDDCSVG